LSINARNLTAAAQGTSQIWLKWFLLQFFTLLLSRHSVYLGGLLELRDYFIFDQLSRRIL
jgi:hypothetical protein